MLEAAVGVAHSIALGAFLGFTYAADVFPSRPFYRQDLADPGGAPVVRFPRGGQQVEPGQEPRSSAAGEATASTA